MECMYCYTVGATYVGLSQMLYCDEACEVSQLEYEEWLENEEVD